MEAAEAVIRAGMLQAGGAITTLRCQQASRPEDQVRYAARNQTPAA
jgi:hypothetical protein